MPNRLPSATRKQASRGTPSGLPPIPAPSTYTNPLSIQVSSSGGVDIFHNTNFRTTDWSNALLSLDAVYKASNPNQITHGHRMIGLGPQNIATQLTQGMDDLAALPVLSTPQQDYLIWGDETSQTGSKLRDGWIQQVGPTTTLLTAIGSGDMTLTTDPATRYIHDSGVPAANQGNAFPSVGAGGQAYTIQFQDTLEQVIIANNGATGNPAIGTNSWVVLTRGANQSYGTASGPAAASHPAGTVIKLIYADPGSVAMRGLINAYNTAHGTSVKMCVVLLGGAITSLGASDPATLAQILSVGDASLYQSQRLLQGMGVPTDAQIAAYGTAVGTNMGYLRTALGAGKPAGIQVQIYDPNPPNTVYDSTTMAKIINTAGKFGNPTWMNLWYLNHISEMEDALVNVGHYRP